MLNKLNSLRDREDGFTLIELLIVVIIIGILAAIALPIFIDQQKVAIDASVASDVRNTVTNVTNAQAQNQIDATADAAVVTPKSNSTTQIHVVKATTDASTTVAPALGTEYKVSAYNTGGKKYNSTTAAYVFSAATGQFGVGAY